MQFVSFWILRDEGHEIQSTENVLVEELMRPLRSFTKWPRIRRRKNWHAGTIGFLVDPGMINGKRERRQFSTLQEAETYAQQLRTSFQNEGLVGLSIPLEVRLEAARCQNKLAEVGASITEATSYFLKHRANYKSAPLISKMVD